MKLLFRDDCNCGNCNQCPSIYKDNDGTFVVQGIALTPETIASLDVPQNEDAVRLTSEVLKKMLGALKETAPELFI